MPDAPLPPELLRIARTGDPLPQLARDRVGLAVRLHVPLVDVLAVRQSAQILASLAVQLHHISHARGAATEDVLLRARQKARDAAAQLESVQTVYRKRRPKPLGY